MSFTNEEKYREAQREAKMRRQVYPRWVEQDRISQDVAERRIALMEQIAADYEQLLEQKRLL